jgi:hypothetical protein
MPDRASAALHRAWRMKKKQTDKARAEQERSLDEALEETFPAIDPVSMQQIITVGRVDRPFPDGVPRVKTEKMP